MRRRSTRIRDRVSESSVTDDDTDNEVIIIPSDKIVKKVSSRSKKTSKSISTTAKVSELPDELEKIQEEQNDLEELNEITANDTSNNKKEQQDFVDIVSEEMSKSGEIVNVRQQHTKQVKFPLDFKKYIIEAEKEKLGLLSNAIFTLKGSIPFSDQLGNYLLNKNNKKNKSVLNEMNISNSSADICGLDSANVSAVVEDKSRECLKQIQVPEDLWFKADTSGSSLHKHTSDIIKENSKKEVERLMKKSVLPDDLERMEKAPILFESHASKKREMKEKREETAGKGWFNLPKTEMTDELKKDMQVLQMRNALDTKIHYKRADSNKLPKYFQVGTIVEGPHEFHSSRVSKKNRKRTLVDELLADAEFRRKNKRRFIDMQKKNMGGGKGHYKKMKNKRKETWARE